MKNFIVILLLGTLSVLLFAACATTVDSNADAGLPKTWCSEKYGITLQRNVLGFSMANVCTADQTCASWSGEKFQCCTLDDPYCGYFDTNTDGDSGFFCSPTGGLTRLPIRFGGTVCAADEICALHKTQDCHYVCCNPAKDSSCGVPFSKQCGYPEGGF
ncbi:MAG TPA: hypothetical protein VHB21_15850 [Minicystis sp.]|nr:hypothetical protein [Minicystis sp.]